ncbi:MAG: hypothetical protein QW057_09605 [Candidatus Bathyarchaeia archaeon]
MSDESTEAAAYARKMKRAAQLLFFQRHRRPGVKGWELKRALGRNYMKVVELLDAELEKLGLEVKAVQEEGLSLEKPSPEELDRARFVLRLRDPLTATDARLSGWRIDDIAALAATVAYIISRQGKALQRDVERLLEAKFPRWVVQYALERFLRRGYLTRDESGMLYLGWRSRAEIDQKLLLNLIMGEEAPEAGKDTPATTVESG